MRACRLGRRPRYQFWFGAKAHALLKGKLSVDYEDVIAVAHSVLRHRIRLNYAASARQITADEIIDHIIQELQSSGSADIDNPTTMTGEQRVQSSKVFRSKTLAVLDGLSLRSRLIVEGLLAGIHQSFSRC